MRRNEARSNSLRAVKEVYRTTPTPVAKDATTADSKSSPSADILVHQEDARETKIWNALFQTSIDCYGKVVDQDLNPVSQADVVVSLENTLAEAQPQMRLRADNDGLFHVSGHGIGLAVQVSKSGYYHLKASAGSFGYSKAGGEMDPHPDPERPAVFTLRKMGVSVPLVRIKKVIMVKTKGEPESISLWTGQLISNGQGDVRVEAWIDTSSTVNPNLNLPFNWRFRISVPGGGMTERKGEFEFEAPTEGYQESDDINMPTSLGHDWKRQATRSYFVHLPNDRYARMELQLVGEGEHFLVITSFLNPTASDRNLEWDQVLAPRNH